MRVGFIGVSGTGKTTVMNLMAEQGYRVKPSLIRDFFTKSGRVEADQDKMTPQEVWDLQKSIFDWKVEYDMESLEGNSIYDRTLLDHYVYCLHRCSSIMSVSVAESMKLLVKENLSRYTHLFYFPCSTKWSTEDGFRQIGTIQIAQDLMIQGFTGELFGKTVYPMPFMTPEERVKYILDIVHPTFGTV